MLNKLLCLFPMLFGVAALLAAAWPGGVTPSARNTDSAFVPQPVPLQAAGLLGKISAKQILEKALANLSHDQVRWLRTKIRQTMVTGRESSFVAEGMLQRG